MEKNLQVDPNNTEIDINSRFFQLFWLPDVFIANSFESIRQSEPVDTRSVQMNIARKNSKYNPHCYITYSSRYVKEIRVLNVIHLSSFLY